jgi:hypothetical protein
LGGGWKRQFANTRIALFFMMTMSNCRQKIAPHQ